MGGSDRHDDLRRHHAGAGWSVPAEEGAALPRRRPGHVHLGLCRERLLGPAAGRGRRVLPAQAAGHQDPG
uniref:Uncharacterized protein n=1 Tax=Parastrongyloides trichosuri TaxID=131310 RepID=A0A0N4ZXX2_PARTI